MVNAREWLEKEYPLEKRVEITDLKIRSKGLEGELKLTDFFKLKALDCSWNKLLNLDLSNCYELTYIECQGNLLTNTDFLAALPSAPKLISLYIGENDFAEQDLSFLQPFENLETLWIWNSHQNRIDEGLINRFQGSLKHLQNMKNLKKLGIGNTNVDSGLECLAESKLEIFATEWYPWGDNGKFSGKIKEAKAEKLFAELRPYATDIKKGKYDFSAWKNTKLIELQLDNERLRNKDSNQKKEIEKLCGELKVIGGELLTRKKKEFEKSAIAEKNQLDEDCQDYLEIFLSAQKGSNIGKLAKKNLLKKIEEKELEELLAKKLEINKLESRLNSLRIQQQSFLHTQIQIPPKQSCPQKS